MNVGDKVVVSNLRASHRPWTRSVAEKLSGNRGVIEQIGKATIIDESSRYVDRRFLSYTVAMDDPNLGAWHFTSSEITPTDN